MENKEIKEIEDETETKKITRHQFYFEIPIYKWIKIEDLKEDLFSGDVDGFSAENKIDTTYRITEGFEGDLYSSFQNFYLIKLVCKRKDNDTLRFFVYKNNKVVVKMGQYPTLADLQFGEIGDKYNKILSKKDLNEFNKAIGLVAHGTGVGSFVYLRRIFENLIYETFDKNLKDLEIGGIDFKKLRMSEKIEILESYLPSQLVEMKDIYGILSKGIHELDEEECLAYFPAIKFAIQLILDQKIEKSEKENKSKEAKQKITDIKNALKK